jgi:hypothetical protein
MGRRGAGTNDLGQESMEFQHDDTGLCLGRTSHDKLLRLSATPAFGPVTSANASARHRSVHLVLDMTPPVRLRCVCCPVARRAVQSLSSTPVDFLIAHTQFGV